MCRGYPTDEQLLIDFEFGPHLEKEREARDDVDTEIYYWRPAPATEAAAKTAGLRKGLFEGRIEPQQFITF